MSYSFDYDGIPFHYVELLMNYTNNSLIITIYTTQKNIDVFNQWSNLVIRSVEIESRNP
jgi:hypothetical protein